MTCTKCDALKARLQAVETKVREAMKGSGSGHLWNAASSHLDDIEALVLSDESDAPAVFDLIAHLERQRRFSETTFGPGDRTRGVINHIRKELHEIEEQPDDLEEWVDVILLSLDGAWRMGATPQQITEAIDAKMTKNENRDWPDWRTADRDKAIEHDRTKDAPAEAAESEPQAEWTTCKRCGKTVVRGGAHTCIKPQAEEPWEDPATSKETGLREPQIADAAEGEPQLATSDYDRCTIDFLRSESEALKGHLDAVLSYIHERFPEAVSGLPESETKPQAEGQDEPLDSMGQTVKDLVDAGHALADKLGDIREAEVRGMEMLRDWLMGSETQGVWAEAIQRFIDAHRKQGDKGNG